MMVRGLAVCGCPSALRKNHLAASASRLAERRKSIVWPRLTLGEKLRMAAMALGR